MKLQLPNYLQGSFRPMRKLALLAAVAAPCWMGAAAQATITLDWDPSMNHNGSNRSGTWNTTNTNWANSPGNGANVAWDNSLDYTADFGNPTNTTGAYLATLGVPIDAAALIFNGKNSGSFTLAGSTLTLDSGSTITVNNVHADFTTTLVGLNEGIQGNGETILAAANNLTGTTVMQTGTLDLTNAGALGTSSLTIDGGATIDATNAAGMVLNNNNMTWAGNFAFKGSHNLSFGTGTVTLAGIGQNYSVNVKASTLTIGAIGDGGNNNGFTKLGAGTLVVGGGASAYSGTTTVVAGKLVLAAGSSLTNSAVSVDSGATFAPNPSAGPAMAGGTGLSLAGGAIFNMSGDKAAGTYADGGGLTASGATFDFDLGANSGTTVYDSLTATGVATASGKNIVNVIGFGSSAPLISGTASYDLIAGGLGSSLSGGTFVFANKTTTSSVVINGITYNLSLSTTANDVVLNMSKRLVRSP